MSLTDIWHELQYFWIDLTNYTYAERQTDRYHKIIRELDKNIPLFEEEILEAKRMGSELNTQFLINGNSAAGKMADYFAEKEKIWDENRTDLISKMETALGTAKTRREEAQQKLIYWEGEAAGEESRLRDELWNRKEEERRANEEDKSW